jgi:hypothetical protein
MGWCPAGAQAPQDLSGTMYRNQKKGQSHGKHPVDSHHRVMAMVDLICFPIERPVAFEHGKLIMKPIGDGRPYGMPGLCDAEFCFRD